VPNSTKRICQLTGDVDRATGKPTLSLTNKRFRVLATDLGSSFEHKGQLYFLFGDTWGRPGDRDALAWTKSTDPEKIILDFHRDKDNKWLPLTVPDIQQGAFEVPSGGISIDGVIYVVCTTDHTEKKAMGRSVLASSRDDGRTFKLRYDLSRDKFIHVSFWLADGWVCIYGSGDYRKSSVCLARVKPADIGNRTKLEYYGGVDAKTQPRWLAKEADAVPLFRQDQIGEFSVAYLPPVKRYVMVYNAEEPRGITLRSAETPWGPWSAGTFIFEPWRDNGYGHLIVIYGWGGADRITVSATVWKPVAQYGGAGNDTLTGGSSDDWLFGDDGNDSLTGGQGNDLLVGGDGNDKLTDGAGTNVLLGGAGGDKLTVGKGDDLLIAGPTDFDGDLSALGNIVAEWTSASSYADRITHLAGPVGGANGTTFLTASTVHDDGAKDVLTGAKGSDHFIVSVLDTLDLKPGEQKLVV
jgi:hypothetical protein